MEKNCDYEVMNMNNELYNYIDKKKQSVVKQYDLLLERIQLSKNPKSAIALMCDEEFVVHDAQYPISELLHLMSDFIDEYYKNNELFQDCTKEITDGYLTYAKEKYSIQFSAPFRYSSEIIVRYHAEHVMHPSFPVHLEIWDTASKMREELIDFYRHKSMKGFFRINHLMFHTYYEKRKGKRVNPFVFCKQCITTVYYMETGLLDRLNENHSEYEAAKEKYEKEKTVFDKEQEEAKEIKEKADEALRFFKELGWKIRYKGIVLEDGTMCL